MKTVVVIGGGGAGLCAVYAACRRYRAQVKVVLIDKKATADFLPQLPDIIGRRVSPRFLSVDLAELSRRLHFEFIRDTVISLELNACTLTLASGKRLSYDYALIASGSETNFYGQENIRRSAYALDSVEDACRIVRALEESVVDSYIVCGAGYTGVEVATNLKRYLAAGKKERQVVIVERASLLLGPLPQEIREYTAHNLEALDIPVLLNTTISRLEGNSAVLSDGRRIDRALVIWAAGVRTPDFVQKLPIEKTPQGRLKVDPYLRIHERCFVAGDTADFAHEGRPLRMAIQFAIFEGRQAMENIVRHAGGKMLKRYRPLDLGYIVPMANNRSCGVVMGVFVSGLLATAMHYFMCLYRAYSAGNRWGVLHDLLFPSKATI